ncbi:MAG TPA: DUF1573 domain-containing protein [Clostridia bacterium]|nr:DUF1573 domain-containing protein [Clostridia bacterium]HHY05491.1 DUF1573 domain-containing protein [Clostridia bacterium]
MAEFNCQDFEKTVSTYLLRHQSILDLLAKCQESSARTNRAITKSVTTCGCLKIKAQKQPLPPEADLDDLKKFFSSHLEGALCDICREIVVDELGKNLFYTTALCNTLGIGLQEVIEEENKKVRTLGKFNLT